MNQSERRMFLITELLKENKAYRNIRLPRSSAEQKELLRGLMNVRPATPVTAAFIEVQDAYLKEANAKKGIVTLSELTPLQPGLYLWQGDITRLKVDAIVNAANSGMTGCYRPCHSCIDNCIHTYAGIQLRLKCDALMRAQGHEEPTGQAKITPAYNLPCSYVIHTVGPIVQGILKPREEKLLAACYRSCLNLAEENGVKSIAFCCISTGVFGFPQQRAAEIAVQTVTDFRSSSGSSISVVFNVFKNEDLSIYQELLT